MSPKKQSNSNILNNSKDHVDSGDVLFVVSGDTSSNQQTVEAFNQSCKSKCAGRKNLNRNFHSKIVDASQFNATCADAACHKTLQSGLNEKIKKNASEMMKASESTIKKSIEIKRLDESTRNRNKARVPTRPDNNWKREVILRQMKNHRVSSGYVDDGSRQQQMIRPAHKLKALQEVFDDFINRQRWENASLESENLSGLMRCIGLTKYGFKITNKSPYATNEMKKTKRRSRSVIDIVPRHNCFTREESRVPSYMGWNWTKCFSEFANSGWRPGAIPKNIRDNMSYFNGPCSYMPGDLKTCVTYEEKLAAAIEQVVARKPTLKVVRKDGLYYVCMNPLKPSEELPQSQDPYLDDCPPIKFRIALNRHSEENDLGLLGYPCSGRPAICEDNKVMQDLLKLLAKECDNDSEFYKLAKTLCSKPSDLDIEFIAPGANVKSIYKEMVYRETQYDKNDFADPLRKTASRSLPAITQKEKKAAA